MTNLLGPVVDNLGPVSAINEVMSTNTETEPTHKDGALVDTWAERQGNVSMQKARLRDEKWNSRGFQTDAVHVVSTVLERPFF